MSTNSTPTLNSTSISTAPLSGMMELLPAHQLIFDQIRHTISQTYQSYGFAPIDTPIIERSEVILAKAGGETEKQIYRFQKGDHDLSLRFDLTVPLARYVVEHQNELTFPFRRTAIGKVYRGERAQKGRYREFYQCDIDVIGLGELDLLYDAEIVRVMADVIDKLTNQLNLGDFTIRLNNRKLLNGFFQSLDLMDSVEVLRIIDKLEKIGTAQVTKELRQLRLSQTDIKKLLAFSQIRGTLEDDVLPALSKINFEPSQLFQTGLAEIKELNNALVSLGVAPQNYCFDLSIARGLDYYTGTVFETSLDNYPGLGSICSGGRYDNLTGSFSKQKMPGVGTSIGLTRFFSQLLENNLLDNVLTGENQTPSATPAQILILPATQNLGPILEIANYLRSQNIKTEVYLDRQAGLKKKMKYANKIGVKYVLVIGDDELVAQKYSFKNMISGDQQILSLDEITHLF